MGLLMHLQTISVAVCLFNMPYCDGEPNQYYVYTPPEGTIGDTTNYVPNPKFQLDSNGNVVYTKGE